MNRFTITIKDNETNEIHTASGDEILLNIATLDEKNILRSSSLQAIGHYAYLSRMHVLLGVNLYNKFFKDNKTIKKEEEKTSE